VPRRGASPRGALLSTRRAASLRHSWIYFRVLRRYFTLRKYISPGMLMVHWWGLIQLRYQACAHRRQQWNRHSVVNHYLRLLAYRVDFRKSVHIQLEKKLQLQGKIWHPSSSSSTSPTSPVILAPPGGLPNKRPSHLTLCRDISSWYALFSFQPGYFLEMLQEHTRRPPKYDRFW